MSRQAYLNDRIITIAAGGNSGPVMVGGTLLIIYEASFAFKYEFDDNGQNSGRAGLQVDTGADAFSKITFYNPSSTVALSIEIGTGLGSGQAGVRYDYLRQRDTRPCGATGTFSGGAKVTLPGIATTASRYSTAGIPAGARRRSIVISNTSNTDDLLVYDSGVQVMDRISPNDAHAYDCTGDIQIGGTDTKTWTVGEFFNT